MPAQTGGQDGSLLGAAFTLLKTALGYYSILLLALVSMQRSLIFQRQERAADPTYTGGRLVRLPRAGEDEAVALYFPAKEPQTVTLAYFHGNADQLGHGPASIGQDFQETHQLGFYGIEYPGYGEAAGSPNEQSIMSAADQLLRHLSALDGLSVPQEQVVLFGQSIGCAVAVEMALRGFGNWVILLSPFSSLHSMAVSAYPFVKPALDLLPFVLLDKFDNLAKVGRVRQSSLVLHGTDDEIVPLAQGQEISRGLPNATFSVLQAAHHNDVWDPKYRVISKVSTFLNAGRL